MDAEIIYRYFPELNPRQKKQFAMLGELYQDWNQKINVVSRKDIDELYLRHVLHSLAIARVIRFAPGSKVLDVGTGGGFPGIPLAILFPDTAFTLVDSVGKKIKVVEQVVLGLELNNVQSINTRVEDLSGDYDYVVSRAVAAMPTFVRWVKGKFRKLSPFPNKGIYYLKGGDLQDELKEFPKRQITPLNDYYDEAFFDTKSVVFVPVSEIKSFK